MDDCEFVALITATACAIFKCCTEDEIAILAVGFSQLGDTLATLLTQSEIREKKAAKKIAEKNGDKDDIDNKKCKMDVMDDMNDINDMNVKEACRQIIDKNNPD